MSKSVVERPPAYKGPSKIPRFAPARAPLPDIEMDNTGGQKPSRLMQLKNNYQDRIMREKEEKMIRMYEDNQKKALGRVNSKGLVRDFFRERREIEGTNGVSTQIPSLNQHFKQKKTEQTRNDESNLFERRKMPPEYNRRGGYARNTVGRDKSNPLAPIDRNNTSPPFGIARKPQIHGRPWTKEDKKPKGNDEYAPRSAPAPHAANPPIDIYGSATVTPSDDTPPPNLNQLKKLQKQKIKTGRTMNASPSSQRSKVSDFQKWQMEQDEARNERLQKHRLQNRGDEENIDEGDDDDILSKQKDLMKQIERQKDELEKMRRDRQREEDEERKEMEKRKRREEERRKRAKEEAERRRQEDEEMRRQEEENFAAQARQRQEEEAQRRLEAESRMNTNRSHRKESESRMMTNRTTRTHKSDTHRETYRNMDDDFVKSGSHHIQAPSPPKHAKPAGMKRPMPRKQDTKYDRVESPPRDFTVDTSMYENAATEDGAYEKVKLVPCSKCGRKFAADRVQRHMNSCDNLTKKRKVLDPTKIRTAGTDMEKYNRNPASRAKTPPKKKSNWRQQHENFIENLRYAKKVTEMQKTGQDLSSLPPPPVTENPDYVQCPICNRSFNPTTAERHIPRCKAPPRKR